ncbi:hypothetical protein CSKR_103179 [Clonorchis sinensis]|uniref:Uncharacterized protein n=1 Tax=Clonorchis sinensis TaxID=79923 RepID=A0A419PNA5_CLOSI|nr:hypothetical protein CSKR_103179 [Clonorchis sinensis]
MHIYNCIRGTDIDPLLPESVTPFRLLTAMPPAESTRAGILPGCPSLDRGSREVEVGFEPRTFRSVNSRSNHLSHLAPLHYNVNSSTLRNRSISLLHDVTLVPALFSCFLPPRLVFPILASGLYSWAAFALTNVLPLKHSCIADQLLVDITGDLFDTARGGSLHTFLEEATLRQLLSRVELDDYTFLPLLPHMQ